MCNSIHCITAKPDEFGQTYFGAISKFSNHIDPSKLYDSCRIDRGIHCVHGHCNPLYTPFSFFPYATSESPAISAVTLLFLGAAAAGAVTVPESAVPVADVVPWPFYQTAGPARAPLAALLDADDTGDNSNPRALFPPPPAGRCLNWWSQWQQRWRQQRSALAAAAVDERLMAGNRAFSPKRQAPPFFANGKGGTSSSDWTTIDGCVFIQICTTRLAGKLEKAPLRIIEHRP